MVLGSQDCYRTLGLHLPSAKSVCKLVIDPITGEHPDGHECKALPAVTTDLYLCLESAWASKRGGKGVGGRRGWAEEVSQGFCSAMQAG